MAKHRHARETNARSPLARAALVAAPVAFLTTATAVTLGVVSQDPQPSRDLLAGASVADVALPERSAPVSRSRSRVDPRAAQKRQERAAESREAERKERRATQLAVRQADTRLWTTEDLNLWTAADGTAEKTGVLDSGERVLVTGRERDGRVEVVVGGEPRWVTAGYLDEDEPLAGISGDCSNGTSVPAGVDPSITQVHRAVCARFPQITSYGTFRSDGEHGQGRAIDIMVSGSLGWEIAEYLRANYAELGIEYLIYAQKIWSVDRGGEGWRGMSDRGSATANHYDHVHVTVY
ncbi:SH3 domain-containing protein [Nocardioides solisilvae]|uniref:SH3 domain-containing protein n=1 Tax=Nocardioides solisilvae TaxID=1542435 RepID=UPI000D74D45E|nr:SH3 domain-containing protein [Nocardioides solisilvae]